MRKRLLPLALAVATLGASSASAVEPPPDDAQLPTVDCAAKTKRTYSLDALLRTRAMTVPVRCDGATRIGVNWDVVAPVMALINTPHGGVPDADGGVTFKSAGTKRVRLKLHKKAANAIKDFNWIRVRLDVVVEFPDYPGWYYGDPEDRRRFAFRR